MDVLTDVLQQAGLRRRLLDLRRLSHSTALRFPCERSIGLHVAVQGPVFVHAPSLQTPLALQAGDIALMARGCAHVVSGSDTLRGIEVQDLALLEHEHTGPGELTLISGAYQLWNAPVHPLFAQMPAWFVLRGERMPRLGPLSLTVALLGEEVTQGELGSQTIVHGLLDVIFGYVLRDVVGEQGQRNTTWGHAVRDVQVRRVLMLMHQDIAAPWTLDGLAHSAGLSRTSLAERFRLVMGDTPLNYLRAVRMQAAMRLLSETGKNLEQVATEVGYQDAFGFSKVFKRVVGLAPKEFRRQDAADKTLPWRLNAST